MTPEVSQMITPVKLDEGHVPRFSVRNLNFYYGSKQVLFNNSIDIACNYVTSIIGPSGCGKSTHLRVYNQIYRLYRDQKAEGDVVLDGENILNTHVDLIELRRKVGMIFQKPTPFPMNVYDNITYGLKLHYKLSKNELMDHVEKALIDVGLWDEVGHQLYKPAMALSLGQQQRLCMARAIAVEPEVILMDEPTSSIDPVATSKIEDLIQSLKSKYTIVIVTHNLQQAGRISDYTAFFYQGKIIEFGKTSHLFTNPVEKATEDYITGRFG